jgi:hypothetical protein
VNREEFAASWQVARYFFMPEIRHHMLRWDFAGAATGRFLRVLHGRGTNRLRSPGWRGDRTPSVPG